MRFELDPFALPDGYGDSIVTLDDLKAHLAIELDEAEFDDLLTALRDAAVDAVEKYCGVVLAERDLVWRAECIPLRLRLPVTPVTALVGIDYLDSSGTLQQGADVNSLARLGVGGEVIAKAGQTWPPSDLDSGVELTFTAGYADDERPASLVTAVKMFAAHLFANREAVVATGQIVVELPLGVRLLMDQYRAVLI